MNTQLLLMMLGVAVLIAVLAGIEIAFVSASKLNIELKRKQGRRSAQILSRIMDRPGEYLGGSRILISLLLIAFGLLITDVMQGYLSLLPHPLSTTVARLLITTAVATAILLIFAEFLPKALFRRKAETVLAIFALPMAFINAVFGRIARLFIRFSELTLKYLFNVRIQEDKPIFNRIDVDHFTRQTLQGHQSDANEVNAKLFENALQLVHTKVRQSMIPRNEIVGIDRRATVEDARRKMMQTHLSRILVYDGTVDKILGYLHHQDIAQNPANIESVMHPILAVPEAMQAIELLQIFRKEHRSVAWVVDEFGGTAGIITMEDVLEEIFGDINDEYDVSTYIERQISETEYVFSGRLELSYLHEKYGFDFGETRAETLSGYIVAAAGRIPRNRERVIADKFEFEMILATENHVDSVKMKVLK